MAGFYHYSPWQDAANFGQGVGQSLGQALAQRPEIQARAREIQQQMQLRQQQGEREQQQFPLEQELLKAQVGAANFRPQYLQEEADRKRQYEEDRLKQGNDSLDIRRAIMDMQNRLGQQNADSKTSMAGTAQQHADAGGDSGGKTPPDNSWSNIAARLSLMKGRESELAPEAGVKPGMPVNPSMALKNMVLQAKTPEDVQAVLGLAQMFPNTQTNDVSSWMGMKHTPEVTTNSFTMGLPKDVLDNFGVVHSGEVPNASLPVPVGVNGQVQTNQAPVKVDSEEAYNALPVGTVYMDSTGKQFTKR